MPVVIKSILLFGLWGLRRHKRLLGSRAIDSGFRGIDGARGVPCPTGISLPDDLRPPCIISGLSFCRTPSAGAGEIGLEQKPSAAFRVWMFRVRGKGCVPCPLHRISTIPDIGTGEPKKPAPWRST